MDEQAQTFLAFEATPVAPPKEFTCTIGSGEHVTIIRNGIRLPDGKIVKNLSGCTLKEGSSIIIHYGESETNSRKTKIIPSKSEIVVVESKDIELPQDPTPVSKINSNTTRSKQNTSAFALVFAILCAILFSVMGTSKKNAIAFQQREKQKKICNTKSDLVLKNINDTIKIVESSRVASLDIPDPDYLYEKISNMMLEIYAINKKLNNRK